MIKKTKNKFESRLYNQLKKSGINFKYESEKIPYILARHYVPDFVISSARGEKIYIEAKGYFRPEHKAKLIAVKKLHPAMDIRLVFYAMNKKYIKWAERNRFPFSIEKIPPDWLT